MGSEELTSKLMRVQSKLKAPKNQYNSFGKYKYRNCEDILEAVKPLLVEEGLSLVITDDIEVKDNGRTYVKAKASVSNGLNEIFAYGYAREPESKKGMDESQVTGASSSYARKYALNGLFLIDDQKDADNMDNTSQDNSKAARAKTTSKPKAQSKTTAQKVNDGVKQQAFDALARYCELHNADKNSLWNGIKKRPNYADKTEFWQGIYEEFNNEVQATLKQAEEEN